jgi:hypothetical protein
MPCRCLLSEVEWRGDDRLRLARLATVPQILGLLHLVRLDEWRAEQIGLVVDRPGGRVAETVGEGLAAVLDPVLRRREVECGRLAQVEPAVDVDRTVGCRARWCRAHRLGGRDQWRDGRHEWRVFGGSFAPLQIGLAAFWRAIRSTLGSVPAAVKHTRYERGARWGCNKGSSSRSAGEAYRLTKGGAVERRKRARVRLDCAYVQVRNGVDSPKAKVAKQELVSVLLHVVYGSCDHEHVSRGGVARRDRAASTAAPAPCVRLLY